MDVPVTSSTLTSTRACAWGAELPMSPLLLFVSPARPARPSPPGPAVRTGRSGEPHACPPLVVLNGRRAGRSAPDVSALSDYRVGNCYISKVKGDDEMRQVVFYPGEDGFWIAECPSLPGCISQGETREKAILNVREAIDGYVGALVDDKLPVPPERFEAVLIAV